SLSARAATSSGGGSRARGAITWGIASFSTARRRECLPIDAQLLFVVLPPKSSFSGFTRAIHLAGCLPALRATTSVRKILFPEFEAHALGEIGSGRFPGAQLDAPNLSRDGLGQLAELQTANALVGREVFATVAQYLARQLPAW